MAANRADYCEHIPVAHTSQRVSVRRWRYAAVGLVAAMLSGYAGWSARGSAEEQPVQPAVYDAHDRRDPFEALITPRGELRSPRRGSAVGTLRVEGILWESARPLAIINGEVYGVGDEVDGYRIIQIQMNALIVETGDSERVVIPLEAEEGDATDA